MSEQTLDDLITKVKSEAIEAADKQAKHIIQEAKQKAKQVLANAEAEKEALLKDTHTQSEALVKKGKIALQQAARDVQISVKNDLQKLFKSVLETDVKEAFTPDVYAKVIIRVIENLGSNITIALPAGTEDALVNAIKNKVATDNKTLNLIKKNNLLSGLSVNKTDEGWSYNISAEDIAELLNHHLSDKWTTMLTNK